MENFIKILNNKIGKRIGNLYLKRNDVSIGTI